MKIEMKEIKKALFELGFTKNQVDKTLKPIKGYEYINIHENYIRCDYSLYNEEEDETHYNELYLLQDHWDLVDLLFNCFSIDLSKAL